MQITKNTIFDFARKQDDLKVIYRDKEKSGRVLITLHPMQIGFEITFTLILNKEKGACTITEKAEFSDLLEDLLKTVQPTEAEASFIRDEVVPLLMEWMWLIELLNTLDRVELLDENYRKEISKVLQVPKDKDSITRKLLEELEKHEPFQRLGAV